MNPSSSSPFPLLTFAEADGGSPATLLKFLRDLVDQHFTNSTDRKAANIQWASLIHGIFDTLGASFPTPSELPWAALHEKIALTDVILDAVMHCIARVDMLFATSAPLTRKTFTRLINLCIVLDNWMQNPPPEEQGVLRPEELQEKAINVTVFLLRNLGGPITVAEKGLEPPWRILQNILEECVHICSELIDTSSTSVFPHDILLFQKVGSENIETPSLCVTIEKVADVPLVLGLLLSIAGRVLSPPLFSDWFLQSISRDCLRTHIDAFHFISSHNCTSSEAKRIIGQSRITTSSLRIVSSLSLAFAEAVSNITYNFLLRRIRLGPALMLPGMQSADTALREALGQVKPSSSTPEANVSTLLSLLQEEQWDYEGDDLRVLLAVYINACIPRLGMSTLKAAREYFSRYKSKTIISEIISTIQNRIERLQIGERVAPRESPKTGISADPTWRPRVTSLVERVIAPDAVSWMDEDITISDFTFASHALGDVHQRFDRPVRFATPEQRLEVAKDLSELVCLLAHPSTPKCARGQAKPPTLEWTSIEEGDGGQSLSLLDSIEPAFDRLFEGIDNNSGPPVLLAAYELLALACSHNTGEVDTRYFKSLTKKIHIGMQHKVRGVRMAAGRTLAAICASPQIGISNQVVLKLLEDYDGLPRDSIKETRLLTAGLVAKAITDDILDGVLLFLIAELASPNVVLRGIAYMQINALARARKQSPYNLVHPHLSVVAPFVISRLCTQPILLRELCQLFSMGQAGFISLTLPHTLPSLFATCARRELARVTQELDKRIYPLFAEHSHEILAHVYLLDSEQETDRALDFILEVLVADAGDPTQLQLDSLLRSCIVNLLTNLVIALGEEDEKRQKYAQRALKKIGITLADQQSEEDEYIVTALLAKYMRGLITHLTEALQNFRGKHSLLSKRPILRALSVLVARIGADIVYVAPQVMACMQALLPVSELVELTLATWEALFTALRPTDLGPHVAVTTASFVVHWPMLSDTAKQHAQMILEYMLVEQGLQLGHHLDEAADLSAIPAFKKANKRIKGLRDSWPTNKKLHRIIQRTHNNNNSVALCALTELKHFMTSSHSEYIRSVTSGDVFDPIVGHVVAALIAASTREGDGTEHVRLLAFECMGILGALDPDRFEVASGDSAIIIVNDFHDEEEALMFALHLVRNVLVGAFRSTSDVQYQGHLAFAIQELLRFCKFTPALVDGKVTVPVKVRNRWATLPVHVMETIMPLLDAGYHIRNPPKTEYSHPLYLSYTTYREWLQVWVGSLISRAAPGFAQDIFGVLHGVIRQKDAAIAHHLFPHLVLHVLLSGSEEDTQNIRKELLTVLQDQIDPQSRSTPEKKILSAQAIFALLDHLNRWVRTIRQDVLKRPTGRRSRVANSVPNEAGEQLLRVDSILSSINRDLMARAALQCKAYALALMNFEHQVLAMKRHSNTISNEAQEYYERLHEIYAHLDEPDGMEGISTMIMLPTLEHQIRQHESTGHWTSAQSCWEVRLQQSPNNLDYHVGLLRCLRNLGHYDTLRTHVKGVLTRYPEWEPELAGFQVESSWMVGDWDDVRSIVSSTKASTPQIIIARLLLALGDDEVPDKVKTLSEARLALGAPIAAAGIRGYRQAYDAFLDLHHAHELELIQSCIVRTQNSQSNSLSNLSRLLEERLESTLPAFKTRERVMSIRRTGFQLDPMRRLDEEVSRSWITSAKLARRAGHWQTAYSAMLQARQSKDVLALMESAKLVKAMGEPLRALHELENSLRLCGVLGDQVIDLTMDDGEGKRTRAKAQMLRARWMRESDRFEINYLRKVFLSASELCPEWESGQFYLGQYQDGYYKDLSETEKKQRGVKIAHQIVKAYSSALNIGTKFVYQTVPRMLTLWLDIGEDPTLCNSDAFGDIQQTLQLAIRKGKIYAWYTAFPQIVSRVGHQNQKVFELLSKLISLVITEYPRQALWLFASVIKSKTPLRAKRGKDILSKLRDKNARGTATPLINECIAMVDNLLALCDYPIHDDKKTTLSMSKDFPKLNSMMPSRLIIPLQESLTANMPASTSSSEHQPFPINAPTFHSFHDEIDIMRSLAKPRKVTIKGDDGHVYMFLGKPKDDLRKDARLMDLNAIINKILKANSDSRRRHLYIRTYGVVTLNEECGFIQWVPNTIPIRPVLLKSYASRGLPQWQQSWGEVFNAIKHVTDREAAQIFQNKVLSNYPPVFHEWFLETFPEPSAWLASRLAYGRTAAVMSMVGFVLGLGDRHCENILLDTVSGAVVHVDFNCLFEKGKSLETPERVPFRLTQNIVDGLGVTGVEGVFRIACELTLQLLRDNKDTLMSILDAFIHDPLVEWEDERRKQQNKAKKQRNSDYNSVKADIDLQSLARSALEPIGKKLSGIYTVGLLTRNAADKAEREKEVSTNNLVQMLIQEASDLGNLGKMYPGWAAWL